MNKHKLAVIVPYRNRPEQLRKFITTISLRLKYQEIPYEIFVINQDNAKLFNRGMLLNIGYRYAVKARCDYMVFHDVDMMPMDVDYSYSDIPIHLSTNFVDRRTGEKTKDIFDEYFGGVTMFTTKDFEKINGYSNKYWGWGYEDNDLLWRCIKKEIPLDTHKYKNYNPTGTNLKLNGTDAYIIGKNFNNLFDFNKPLSIFISFYPDEMILNHTKEVDNFPIFSLPGYNTEILYNSFLRYSFITFDNNKNVLYTSSNIKPNYKTNICVTVDPENKCIKTYQDGILYGQINYDESLFDYSIEQLFYIGCGFKNEYKNIENYFKGYFDKFAVWNKTLSDNEVYSIGTCDAKEIKLTDDIGEYLSSKFIKLYYDANFIRDYKLVDLSGNQNDGEIVNCEVLQKEFSEYVETKIPYRRESTFYLLPHEENGYLNNKWKSEFTRYNQLRYHNEVKKNDKLMIKDGLVDLNFLEYGKQNEKGYTLINVGL